MHANLDNVVYLDNFYSPPLIANLPNLSCERILHFFFYLAIKRHHLVFKSRFNDDLSG